MKGVRDSVSWQSLYCSMESWVRPLARVLLALLGLILWGAAAALVFGGAFVILTYKNYKSFFGDCFLLVPGWLAIVSAFLLLPTGALAICISTRNSRYQQGTFMYLLLVLLCLEASSAVLAHVYSDRMSSELNCTMGHLFHQYNGTYSHHPGSRAVDVIQRQLQCCGVHNYMDWAEAAASHTGNIHAPESCCKETYSDCTGDVRQSEQLYHGGCLRKLGYRLQFVLGYVFWCCIVVGFLEMLAAISNGILMKHRPFQDFRILDSATFS